MCVCFFKIIPTLLNVVITTGRSTGENVYCVNKARYCDRFSLHQKILTAKKLLFLVGCWVGINTKHYFCSQTDLHFSQLFFFCPVEKLAQKTTTASPFAMVLKWNTLFFKACCLNAHEGKRDACIIMSKSKEWINNKSIIRPSSSRFDRLC